MSTESPSFKRVAKEIAASLNNFVDWQTAMNDVRAEKRAFEKYRDDMDLKFQRADGRIASDESRFRWLDLHLDRLDQFKDTGEARFKALKHQLEDIRAERPEDKDIRKLTDRIEALEAELKRLRFTRSPHEPAEAQPAGTPPDEYGAKQ